MMKSIFVAAAVAALSAGSALAQEAAAPQAGGPATGIPVLGGATASPECGNLNGLNGKAFCVTTPLSNMQTVGEAYMGHLAEQGWEPVLTEASYLVFVRQAAPGRCEGLQMIAFFDDSQPESATTPGYLGFGSIPAIPCAPQAAAAAPTMDVPAAPVNPAAR
jgi:hypothetical protein